MTEEPNTGASRDALPGAVAVPAPTFIERFGVSPLLFAYVSLVIIFVIYQIVGGGLTVLLFGFKPTMENATGFRAATAVGQILLILLPTLFLSRLATHSVTGSFRLRPPTVPQLFFPLIGIFSLQQLLQIYLVLQDRIPLPETLQAFSRQFKELIEEAFRILAGSSTVPELLLVILVLACVPAIVEELLFRGLVLSSFERTLTPAKSVVLSGIIFGAYHLNPFTFVALAALGAYLGFLTVRANSIWVSIAAHFYNNVIAVLAMYLQANDDAILTGDPNEMPISMLLGSFALLAALFAASTYGFLRVTSQPLWSQSTAPSPGQ